jgi:hypothetical protein
MVVVVDKRNRNNISCGSRLWKQVVETQARMLILLMLFNHSLLLFLQFLRGFSFNFRSSSTNFFYLSSTTFARTNPSISIHNFPNPTYIPQTKKSPERPCYSLNSSPIIIITPPTMSTPTPGTPEYTPQEILTRLCQHATHELLTQPPRTQAHLSHQTSTLFARYAKHGTTASLHAAISRYFKHPRRDKDSEGVELMFAPPLPLSHVPPPMGVEVADGESRMVDDESRSLVRGMEFRVDRMLAIRPNVTLPAGILEAVEKVFRCFQWEAERMLEWACEKYGDEAIFRVGVRALIMRYVAVCGSVCLCAVSSSAAGSLADGVGGVGDIVDRSLCSSLPTRMNRGWSRRRGCSSCRCLSGIWI